MVSSVREKIWQVEKEKKRQENTDMTSSFKNVDKDTSLSYLRMLINLEDTDVMENIDCKPIIINGENTFKDAIKYNEVTYDQILQK